MLTDDQLADRLRARLRHEVAAVEPPADLLDRLRRRDSRRSLGVQLSIAGAPAAAAAATVAVLVATAGSGAGLPPKAAVLTAATVHRMANASRLALAHSGRAVITYRERTNGALQVSGRFGITFAGKDWNAVISQSFPARNGQPASSQTAINRIVDGQFYLHTEGKDGRVEWLRDTSPHGHPSISIPDPRTLFGLLNPSAKFKVTGHKVTGGVRLTELRATGAPVLPALGWLPGVDRGVHVASLIVWVDRHDVVHQMSLRTTQHHTSDPIFLKKNTNGSLEIIVPRKAFLKEAMAMARKVRKHAHVTVSVDPSLGGKVRHYFYVTSASVTFSDFGTREVIKAPKHAQAIYGRG
ncbi:MAG TPA: hypothetical protein VF162_16395 [Streptosporangiaceae bacterium]